MALQDRLRNERERLHLSQADIAEKAGISRNTQVRYETGKTLPSSAYLETIRALGVDVEYVLFGVPEGEVRCPYLVESSGSEGIITLEDCRHHAAFFPTSGRRAWWDFCQGCPKNPITHRVIPKVPAEIDGALLAAILEGFEDVLLRANKKAVAAKKAQAVVMLYRASKATGEIDLKTIEMAALLASE